MIERDLQRLVVDLARLTGWAEYHTYDSRRSNAGFPDLVLVRSTRLIFAELKADNGRTTADQRRWLELLEPTGVEVYLWYPQDWENGTIQKVLRRR